MWKVYSAWFTKAGFTCDATTGQCFSTSDCSDSYTTLERITVQIGLYAYVIPPQGYT